MCFFKNKNIFLLNNMTISSDMSYLWKNISMYVICLFFLAQLIVDMLFIAKDTAYCPGILK
uniref:Uncharacterized protein n=1 Tax=Anguilla anguilla TaxID=7936 RepID=A0A0E9SC20_ANGAN